MNFITPKNKKGQKITWLISHQTRLLVKHYAMYSEYSEDEVVDEFLKNLWLDEGFQNWLAKRRNKKRLLDGFFSANINQVEEEF
ncbi:MAG: hypothetical protein HPY50_09260 [Firmicutes bacterium]|nr:hypothetical protein [Bacillota bacterium]